MHETALRLSAMDRAGEWYSSSLTPGGERRRWAGGMYGYVLYRNPGGDATKRKPARTFFTYRIFPPSHCTT